MRTSLRIAAFLLALTFPGLAVNAADDMTIQEIQGRGHRSTHVGEWVRVAGVVTHIAGTASFYMQAPSDGDDATSDAIFVRARKGSLGIGDQVVVEGKVAEWTPFGRSNDLTTTTIDSGVARKQDVDVEPVGPLVNGLAGRMPPTEAIVLSFSGRDPTVDGAAFYESLESMLLSVQNPVVVGPMGEKKYSEFHVVAEGGNRATGMNSLGGITSTPGDFNPERIKVQIKQSQFEDFQVGVGDTYDSITGIMSYDSGSYELILTAIEGYSAAAYSPSSIAFDDAEALTLASYNVENLDPKDEDEALIPNDEDSDDDDVGDGKFASIAEHIVAFLGSPDIVALQEVQDNDGAEYSDTVAADLTLTTLADAIRAAGGPQYQFVELVPTDDGVGGMPGGNIRAAFLYNADRVQLLEDSVVSIEGDAFANSRLPLAAAFEFGGRRIVVINVHLSSKGGSDPLYGSIQPPRDVSAGRRLAQTRAVREYIRTLDEEVRVVVLGDFNAFWYEEPMMLLTGGVPALTNLALTEDPLERVSYTFDGNSQSLDHALVLLDEGDEAELRTLHVNSIRPTSLKTSDHDPKLVQITFGLED